MEGSDDPEPVNIPSVKRLGHISGAHNEQRRLEEIATSPGLIAWEIIKNDLLGHVLDRLVRFEQPRFRSIRSDTTPLHFEHVK